MAKRVRVPDTWFLKSSGLRNEQVLWGIRNDDNNALSKLTIVEATIAAIAKEKRKHISHFGDVQKRTINE